MFAIFAVLARHCKNRQPKQFLGHFSDCMAKTWHMAHWSPWLASPSLNIHVPTIQTHVALCIIIHVSNLLYLLSLLYVVILGKFTSVSIFNFAAVPYYLHNAVQLRPANKLHCYGSCSLTESSVKHSVTATYLISWTHSRSWLHLNISLVFCLMQATGYWDNI